MATLEELRRRKEELEARLAEQEVQTQETAISAAEGQFKDFSQSPHRAKAEKIFPALIQQESGGRHFGDDGQLLRSSAGAEGITQLMPTTQKQPGFGVMPLQNKSEDEFKRLGLDYFTALLDRYDGDERKALAAYNAGPGSVEQAVEKQGNAFLSALPEETQSYVSNITGVKPRRDTLTFQEAQQLGLPEFMQADEGVSLDELRKRRQSLETKLTPEQREQFTRLLQGGEATDVETGPLPVPPEFELASKQRGFKSSKTVAALEAGVIPDQPAPARAIAESSFGLTEQDQMAAIQQGIELYTGQPTELRVGPKTGELEYLRTDPKTGEKRFATVNEIGLGVSDVAGLAGPAVVGAFETVGALMSVFRIKAPRAGENLTALGAGIGEMVRLMIGKELFGINQELEDPEDFLIEGAKMAGISKLSARTIDIGVKIGKTFQNLLQGRVIPQGVAKRIRELFQRDASSIQEAQQVQDDINTVLKEGGSEPIFELNLAQKSGDTELLDIQASMRRDPFVGPRLRARRREQQEAAETFFNISAKQNDVPLENAPDVIDLGQEIRQLIVEGLTSERRVASQLSRQARAEQRLALQKTNPTVKKSDVTPDQVVPVIEDDMVGKPYQSKYAGNPLREALVEEYSYLAHGFTNAFEGLKRISGVTEIPLNNTRLAVSKLDAKTKEAIFPITVGERRRAIKGFDPEVEAGSPEAVADQLKWLNDKIRRSKEPGADLNTQTLLDLKNALEQDAIEAYGKTPADLEMWQELKRQYGLFKDRFNRTAIDTMIRRSEGRRFDINNEEVFKQYWKPDNDTLAQDLRTALAGRPDAISAVRRGIFAEYRDFVVIDDAIDPKKHKEWLSKYEGNIKPFFSKKEMEEIRKSPLGLSKAIQKSEERSAALLEQINNKLETKFETVSPGNMFKLLWHGDNAAGENLRSVLPIIKDSPELVSGLKNLAHQHLRQSVTSRHNGFDYIDVTKLDNYLGEFAFRDRIRTLFGDKYLQNLDTINKGLLLARREGEFIPEPTGSALKDVIRAQVGIFTKPGRILTAATRVRSKAANEIMVRALLDVDDAERFATMASIKPGTERAIQTATALGAPEFYLVDKLRETPSQRDIMQFNNRMKAQQQRSRNIGRP